MALARCSRASGARAGAARARSRPGAGVSLTGGQPTVTHAIADKLSELQMHELHLIAGPRQPDLQPVVGP